MIPDKRRWRYRTPTKTGTWRLTKLDAQKAAVRAGVGHLTAQGSFYGDPFTVIEADGPRRYDD